MSSTAVIGTLPVSDKEVAVSTAKTAQTAKGTNLRLASWIFRSKYASVLWLVVRIWLGYQWLNAGYQKIWGSEKMGFWYGGGAGVFGFAKAGVAANSQPYGAVGYGWWAAFLHNFVMPNSSWIAKSISIGELAIGLGLLVGLFTGAAAFAGITLNFVYMMTGSAGVNPFYAFLGLMLVLAWRNAGVIGLDSFALKSTASLSPIGSFVHKLTHRQPPLVGATTD